MGAIWRDAISGASILAVGALLVICHLQKTIEATSTYGEKILIEDPPYIVGGLSSVHCGVY